MTDSINIQLLEKVKVGEQVTLHLYSDAVSYTVVAKTKTTMTVQKDFQEIDKEWKPSITPGGFMGHCDNGYSQKWIVKPNPDAEKVRVHATKKNGRFTIGSDPFYDYNF